jgi:tetratricopeptide (TPR) repeat protein
MSRVDVLLTITAISMLIVGVLVWILMRFDHLRMLDYSHPDLSLRRKGLDLLLAGKPAEAERYFRGSLLLAESEGRVRALVCLADALMDQGRFEEAKESLVCALEIGDPIGSCQGSLADLLLLTGTDPEKAIEMADKALELWTQRSASIEFNLSVGVSNQLSLATNWARRARAHAQLDRREEARQAVHQALQTAEAAEAEPPRKKSQIPYDARVIFGTRRLAKGRYMRIANVHWEIGLALLAIEDPKRAADHFRVTRDMDRLGKYRNLAKQQLKQLDSKL